MLPPYQTYLDNLAQIRSLTKPRFAAGASEADIISAIRENAEHLFEIKSQNDAILKEILFSKEPETLTEAEAAALSELADALFNYNRSPDVGIAYRIHQLLYARACRRNDTDRMIRELYCQGITLMYMNVRESELGVNLFVDQIGEYFRAGAAFLPQFESLQSSETRGYIIRCLGNVKYGLRSVQGGDGHEHAIADGWNDYMQVFDRTMSIVESPRYRAMDPNIPWDSFCYTMHYDRTQFLSSLRSGTYPEIAKAVLVSAEYVYRHQEQIARAGERAVGIRTQYVYAAARFHNGLIPLQELIKTLVSICDGVAMDDLSGDAIWAILTCPEYLKSYNELLPPAEQEQLAPHIQHILDRQSEYLFRMPPNEYASHISRTLQITSSHVAQTGGRFSQQVLDYILACHPPTFVHSEVVAMLTRWFCERFAQTAPEALNGLFGEAHPAEGASLARVLQEAYLSGLYHDIGKCMLLSCVGQYSRRLLDEEFLCIRQHPRFGCSLLDNLGLHELSSAAKFHHRSYDREGGYPFDPTECPQSVALVVDIITVVDSLDAGTDNVGRSYAAAKTFEQLVEELRAGSGRRYAPHVVALLDDADFFEATRQFLTESRHRAYLDAYLER